jgi:hypothetical protein
MPLSAVAKIAITAAMTAAQMAMTAMQRFKGPRLDSLDVTTAEYGTPIMRFWGITKYEPPIIWAEKLREQKKTSKTKGGKYANYKYFGTWAVLITDREIDKVSRIWFDKHLVYDVTQGGPISIVAGTATEAYLQGRIKLTRGKNMRIYEGTETQTPDPRMEAWCEDRYGPDSCPAYRGSAYIVFEEIPLEKFGNRIPQISVEAVSAASDNFIYEDELDDDSDWNHPVLSKDAGRLFIGGPTAFQLWDLPTRSKMTQGGLADYVWPSLADYNVAIDGTGRIWATVDEGGDWAIRYWGTDGLSGASGAAAIFDSNGTNQGLSVLQALSTAGGDQIGMTNGAAAAIGLASAGAGAINIAAYPTVDLTGSAWIGKYWAVDGDGNAWVMGQLGTAVTFFSFEVGDFTVTLGGGEAAAAIYHYTDDTHDQFLLFTSAGLYLIAMDGTVLDGPLTFEGSDVEYVLRSTPPGQPSLYFSGFGRILEYSCVDGSLVRDLSASNWIVGGSTSNGIYDPVNHAWISFSANLDGAGTNGLRWYYIDRVASDGVTLETVVDDVADWCGVDVDASALDQVVQGYSVTQGTGKDMIAPLLDIHDVDPRPHDFTIQFLKRGATASLTLATADFVREGDEARYTVEIAQDTDLPRRITLNFADIGKDQQTNTVISQRPLDAADTVRELTLDLTTYSTDPAEAQKLTDRYFRRQWVGRETVSMGLTAQNLALEPGDVRTLELDGVTRTARCTKVVLSAGALRATWERDFPGLATLGTGTGAPMEGRDPEIIYIPSPSKGFVLDIPLITDADNNANPLLYYGAGKYLTTASWPGAAIYEGDLDGEDYTDWNAVDSSQGATWGYALGVLADANPWLWDRGSTVNVDVKGGALSSVTEAEIDADPTLNMAYLGGELLNFTTAFLEADGTYTLSGFKRGRRGTEGWCSTHAAGDEFVMVDYLLNEGIGLSEVGESENFKVATLGRDPAGSTPIEFTFAGNSLRPYAPIVRSVTSDPSTDDITIEFDRRTRVGGSWNGSLIPLSEASEAYELDVYDGDDVVRTLTATTETTTYTAAQQTTDFGAPIAANDLDGRLYQMSAAVGRGFAASA